MDTTVKTVGESAFLKEHPDSTAVFDVHATNVEPLEGNDPPAEPAGGEST